MLLSDVLARADRAQRAVVLDSQSYLVPFYTGRGFIATGPEFVEDGIPHVPMRREAG